MPLKRKTQSMTRPDDQMSFFDPVYQHEGPSISDDGDESEGLADGIPRTRNPPQAHEDPIGDMISKSKIVLRIQQIENSIEQARMMLHAMNKIKNLVPDNDHQCEKLRSILMNLEDQKLGYCNLLQLLEVASNEEETPTTVARPPMENNTSLTPQVDDENMDQVIQLQKEQLRALKEQKRALLALKQRSEIRLIEQQDLVEKKTPPSPTINEQTSLLSDIHNLRDRLTSLRHLYEQKHQLQQIKKSSTQMQIPTEKGLKELEGVQHRLNELEQLVLFYPSSNSVAPEEVEEEEDNEDVETIIERPSRSVQYRKPSESMDKLAMKRAELQKMIEKIRLDDEASVGYRISTEQPASMKNSGLEKALNVPLFTPTSSQYTQTELTCSKMKASFISDIPLSPQSTPKISPEKHDYYDEQLNDSRNRRPPYRSINDESHHDDSIFPRSTRLQQSNVYGTEVLLSNNDHLSAQMDRITRCLSSFIEEQRAFNQQIEERLSKSLHSNANDQFQQQIVTQGLLVNLNTAYREIAVLQSEINALNSENTRLTSSISFDQQYHHNSPQKCAPIVLRQTRPPPRTHFKDDIPEETPLPKSYATSHDVDASPDRAMIFSMETIKSEKQTPIVDMSHGLGNDHIVEKVDSENFASPRPTPTCRLYTGDQENREIFNTDRRASIHSNHRDGEQFDDLSYMLSAISHPYKNSVNSTDLDLKTLDLQIKSILVPLVPFLRFHIHENFNENLVDQLYQRTIVLFHQQLNSNGTLTQLPNHVLHAIERTLKKYAETGVREKASSLIHDLSEIAFNELIIQQNQYSDLYDAAARCHIIQSITETGDETIDKNVDPTETGHPSSQLDPQYPFENDDDDDDDDDDDGHALEASLSCPKIVSPITTELHSNGQGYILVNQANQFQDAIENEIVDDILT